MKAFLVIMTLCALIVCAVLVERKINEVVPAPVIIGVGTDDGSTVACDDGRLKPVIDPKVGEIWCRKPGNPFNDDRIKIVEVLKGYYRYSLEVTPYQSFESYNAPLNFLCDFVTVRSDGTCPEADKPPKVLTKQEGIMEDLDRCLKGEFEVAAGDVFDYTPEKDPFVKNVDRHLQILEVKGGYFKAKVYPGGVIKSEQIYTLCVSSAYDRLRRRAPKEAIKP